MKVSRERISALITILAEAEGIPDQLCLRVCQVESAFNPEARSSKGALGLFQLMPRTAQELGVNPLKWHENVFGGVRYLARLVNRYQGDTRKALAAYNWGMGNLAKAVNKWGSEWESHLPAETAKYLDSILKTAGPAPAPKEEQPA